MLGRMNRPTCVRCGEPLPDEAKFCPNCGFPVGSPLPEERKIVTVVFADLVGSTRLSAQIDAERYREVVTAFYQAVTEELESLRGRAYNFAGDAVVGVFGIPHAHDDDAIRAIRAALSIVKRVTELGQSLLLPVSLQCRVGVNTGRVAIGTEGAEAGLLYGAVVNAAARIQQAAEPGTVLAGETTWLITKDHIQYAERQEVRAKGFEGTLPAWPVLGLAPRSTRRTIPFVDRRRELRLLVETFERAQEARRGHMVTLLGEPGIGKSRVVEEFLAGLPDPTRVLTGRASPFEEDITFGPVAQILLQEIGEPPDAPPEQLEASLEELVRDCCPTERTKEIVDLLRLALGLGDESRDRRRYRVAEIRSGLLALLQGLAARGPVVMVVEDAHLAQPPLLDLVEQLVRAARTIPLFVLCVARYDLLDKRPDWGGGLGDSLNLHLEAMSISDAIELAREASEGLDEDSAARIARHAGGNPFFIVETTGMLMHADVEMASDTEQLPPDLLPPTVQAIIAARIDHLPEEARDLIRKASVFAPGTFDRASLAIVAEPDDKVLELLADEEFLVRDEDREGYWRFRHGLLRDVAYDSLPKRERLRLHLQVATKLSEDPDISSRYPRSIAYHLEQAARASLDLNPADRGMAERAVEALVRAGDQALETSQARTAADLYERALSLAGPEREWGVREARILAGLGEARYWLGEFESAVSPLTRAREIGGTDPQIRANASRFLGDIELSIRGNPDRAEELLEQALAAARELGDPWTLARTLLVAGWAPYWRNDKPKAREMFEEALAVARANPEGDPWAESRALSMVATLVEDEGDQEEALALSSEALAIAETSGDRFSVAVARESVGNALRRLARQDEALPHLNGAVDAFRELGARWELASALTSRGILHRVAGRIDQAVKDLREAYRLCRELKERGIVTWTASQFAIALVRAGELQGAREVLEETAAAVGSGGPGSVDWLLEAEVEILLAEGDRDGALEKAMELLRLEREQESAKDIAARAWWIARVFGPDAVGGEEEMERARTLLEETHWQLALIAPDVVTGVSRWTST
jgi:class 3 adenylate cyclase/tetratricopeptide (TPR) repeat protein